MPVQEIIFHTCGFHQQKEGEGRIENKVHKKAAQYLCDGLNEKNQTNSIFSFLPFSS